MSTSVRELTVIGAATAPARSQEWLRAARRARMLSWLSLAWIAGRSQNLVSHHLRALRSNGLVDSRRAGKMVMYSLNPAGRALLAAVLPAELLL